MALILHSSLDERFLQKSVFTNCKLATICLADGVLQWKEIVAINISNPSETPAIAIIALTMPWKIVQNKNEILPERSMFTVITEHDNNTVREASQYTAHTHSTLSLRLAQVSFSRKMLPQTSPARLS